MRSVYLDNASTTFPKAPGVAEAMSRFLLEVGCNVNRGGYEDAYTAEEVVFDTRERLCRLFRCGEPRNVVFTTNVTAALNLVLKGFLKPGDHALVSAMEHNAVMRPLTQLAEKGVTFDRIPCDREGRLSVGRVEGMIRPNTRMLVLTHASNVCGTLMPIGAVGELCRRHGVRFVVDAAQTGGVFPIDMERMKIDALCFTGHKGLLGPQGTGGVLLREELAAELTPLLSGGTGSFSEEETVPPLMPDRLEPGTPNLPGIYGLNAALHYLEGYGCDSIRAREWKLTVRMTEGLEGVRGVRLAGVKDPAQKTSILSLDFQGMDNAMAAFWLESEFGIMTRCGMHCAPNAHKTLGTFPQGTVRFAISHFNTAEEIDYTVESIRALVAGRER